MALKTLLRTTFFHGSMLYSSSLHYFRNMMLFHLILIVIIHFFHLFLWLSFLFFSGHHFILNDIVRLSSPYITRFLSIFISNSLFLLLLSISFLSIHLINLILVPFLMFFKLRLINWSIILFSFSEDLSFFLLYFQLSLFI